MFSVRRMTSNAEIFQLAAEKWSSEGFEQGPLDHICFRETKDGAFYVGELDNEPVGFISIFKHTLSYSYIGQFLVYKPFRGQGYGVKLWKRALEMALLDDQTNTGLVSTKQMEHIYEQYGFKRAWLVVHFQFIASLALKNLGSFPKLKVVPISDKLFDEIVEYDSSVIGFSRKNFLQKWLYATKSCAYVATTETGRVSGYVVARTTLRPEEGWWIGPLFADDSNTAKSLYKAVFNRMSAEDEKTIIFVDTPSTNISAVILARELLGTEIDSYVWIYTKGIPSGLSVARVFGHTALGFC